MRHETIARVSAWIMGCVGIMLCILGLMGGSLQSVEASDQFGFGKDGSIEAAGDITIGGSAVNGGGTIKRDDVLLDVIKGGVNRVLGILALIALAYLIFGGIKMLTARGEEGGYSDGIKIIQRAVIGLLLIGVAWFIISAIFWLMREAGQAAQGQGANTDQ